MAKQRFSGPTYANGNHKSQQKAYMKGKGRKIRLEADRLAAKLPGGKVGDGLDAAHNKMVLVNMVGRKNLTTVKSSQN